MTLSYLDRSVAPWLPSCAEMAEFDQTTIDNGVPALELMQRAGHAAFDVLLQVLFEDPEQLDSVLIFCGPGNNGGDGLVLAQKLKEKAHQACVILAGADRYSDDCRIQIQKALWCGVEIFVLGGNPAALSGLELKNCDEELFFKLASSKRVFVDCLLGTGQSGAARGNIAKILELFKAHRSQAANEPFVIAVDVPTGVNADSGEVFEAQMRADITLSIELVKRGLLQSPAAALSGKIVVAPIGIDCSKQAEFSLLRADQIKRLPKRAHDFHKGKAGKILIIGGSQQMPGAVCLSALAALRAGAGLVSVAVLQGVNYSLAPEAIQVSSGDGPAFKASHHKALVPHLEAADVLLIGPGMGQTSEQAKFLDLTLSALEELNKIVVLDADALNLLAQKKHKHKLKDVIYTPHPGEAARLLDLQTSQIQKDRYESVKKLHQLLGGTVLLKGGSSLLYHQKRGWVNSSGGPYMATAGSGDVLAGMMAALVAQALMQSEDLFEAVKLATFAHGLAADRAHAKHNGPIIASDIIENIPFALAHEPQPTA